MGYQAQLAFMDDSGRPWVGTHRSDFVDLSETFWCLTKINQEALRQGGDRAEEALRAVLPANLILVQLLGHSGAQLHAKDAPRSKDLMIKFAIPQPYRGLRWLASRVEHSRSQRAYIWAHRLRAQI